MNAVLLVVSFLVVVFLVFLGYELLVRRRESSSLDEQCTAEAAFEHYVGNPHAFGERDRAALASLDGEDAEAGGRAREAVGAAVRRALADPEPQAALRQEIMDCADRFVLAETVAAARGPEPAESRGGRTLDHTEAVLEAGALRAFAKLRFGDHAADDWYAHYLKVAEMNSQNVTAMVSKAVRGEQSVLETTLHEPLSRTMRQVREALLRFPPRTPVRQAHKLTASEAPARLHPTQQQVDRLTEIMSSRFEKLFAGQVYRSSNGSPVNRSVVFQLDAGLLYTMLDLQFRHPTEAWRKVMTEALGGYRGVMEDEKALLETAQVYARVWREHDDGPLAAMVDRACDRAEAASDGAVADRAATAGAMAEDARLLVGKLRAVVDERGLAQPPRSDPRPT